MDFKDLNARIVQVCRICEVFKTVVWERKWTIVVNLFEDQFHM